MMIRSLVASLLLLGGFSCLHAQKATAPASIEWGAAYNEPNNSTITKVVDVGPDYYYLLRQKQAGTFSHPKAFLERYDGEQLLQRSQELQLKYKGNRRRFEDMVKLNGQFYFFTSFLNEAQRMNYLFFQTLNQKMIPSGNVVKIAETPAPNQARPGRFEIAVSEDSTKVFIFSQLDSKKREPERFTFRIFDNQLQLIWKKDIILPYSEQQFEVEDYKFDEAGNVFLLGKQYLSGTRDSRGGIPNYQYIILAYTKNGEDKHEYQIGMKDRFITDLTFKMGNDGKLVCAGFYSEQDANSVKGTCFFNLDLEQKKVSNVRFSEFDFEFRAQGLGSGSSRRAARAEGEDNRDREAELRQYSLDKLILRSDGGAVLIAEQYFVLERFRNNFAQNRFFRWDPFFYDPMMMNNQQVDYVFNYNDIIVVNIRPDGSIEWSARIPKLQRTLNDGGYYSSYAMAVVRDRLFFVFNDNSRNFAEDGSDRLYNIDTRRPVLTLAEVTKDGELQMYPIKTQNRVLSRPKVCRQVGSRRMIIYGEWGKGYRLGELTFE